VLIDGSGVARLADFGCSTITGQSDSYSQLKFVFSARFVAPELVSSRMEDVSPVLTKESDTYSFALVALHVRFSPRLHADRRLIWPVSTGADVPYRYLQRNLLSFTNTLTPVCSLLFALALAPIAVDMARQH
jgi:hypothetical protein